MSAGGETFPVRAEFRVVRGDGVEVGERIVLEYLTVGDGADAAKDAAVAALARYGMRVECVALDVQFRVALEDGGPTVSVVDALKASIERAENLARAARIVNGEEVTKA